MCVPIFSLIEVNMKNCIDFKVEEFEDIYCSGKPKRVISTINVNLYQATLRRFRVIIPHYNDTTQ